MDPTPGGQLVTILFLPVPMVAALSLGIALGAHRVAALTSLAVVLSLGTFLRRFGPRGLGSGMLLFMGDFFGFFLRGAVTLGDGPSLALRGRVAQLRAQSRPRCPVGAPSRCRGARRHRRWRPAPVGRARRPDRGAR